MIPVLAPTTFMPQPVSAVWSGPSTNLIHRWQMDTGSISGGAVNDLVGTDNATITGSPSTVSSPSGAFAATALGFSGSGQYLTLGSHPLTSLASAYTIAYWINLPDITFQPDGGGGTNPRFYDFYDGSNEVVDANIANTTPGAIDHCLNGSTGAMTSAAVLSNNTWTHIAVTFDGSSTYKIYVNGSLAATTTTFGSGGGGSTTNVIAARDDGIRAMKGDLYQFVVYNAALSAGNITTLYNAK